jgi:calcium-binding protein CML
MKGLAGLGKSKKLETATSGSFLEVESSPKAPPASSKETEKMSGVPGLQSPPRQSFISRIKSGASLKSLRTKSGSISKALQSRKRDENVITELKNAFSVFDTNGDGKICISELGAVLRSLGNDVSEHDLNLIMKDVDTDNDGFISLKEFIDCNNQVIAGGGGANKKANGEVEESQDLMRDAFNTFDKDGNELISADELHHVFLSLGDKDHTLEDCRRMISSVDKDGDGFVDYKEFQRLMGGQK